MDRVDLADTVALHHAFLDHGLAAAAAFLVGLEDEHGLACEVARLGEVFRRPEQHRRVPVMPAGMHLAGHFRGMLRPRDLVHGQRVHIRPQSDHRPRAAALDHGDDTALGPARADLLDAELFQPLHDESRRLVAVAPQLGVHVDVPPPGLHLLGKARDTIDNRHVPSP
jgi:hypothetical protein